MDVIISPKTCKNDPTKRIYRGPCWSKSLPKIGPYNRVSLNSWQPANLIKQGVGRTPANIIKTSKDGIHDTSLEEYSDNWWVW